MRQLQDMVMLELVFPHLMSIGFLGLYSNTNYAKDTFKNIMFHVQMQQSKPLTTNHYLVLSKDIHILPFFSSIGLEMSFCQNLKCE